MRDEVAEMLLRGEKLPPDLPRVDAIAAWLRAHELRLERTQCCVCGYTGLAGDSMNVRVHGKMYCSAHAPRVRKETV